MSMRFCCCLPGCRLVVLAVLMSLASGGIGADAPDDDQRFTRLTESLHDEEGQPLDFSKRAEIILERFGSFWSDEDFADDLVNVSDEVLSLRLRAAEMAAFYPESWVLERFHAVIEVAHERGLARADQIRSLFDAYQVAWDFDAAESLRQQYPDAELPELPELVSPPEVDNDRARIVWQIHDDPPRLKGDVVELDGPRLLVVTSPGCGFCHRAARALPGDDILGPLMEEHALWIAASAAGTSYHYLVRWNDSYPASPTMLVDDPEHWPIDDFFHYPQFIFVQGERVEEKLVGWGGGSGALQAIAEGYAGLGLLDLEALPKDAFDYADKPASVDGCPTREVALERSNERALISTRDELDDHLADIEAGADSPLLALSEEARRRLVDSISFGSRGVAGFRHDDLVAQLEPEGFYEVVSLFGMQYFYAGQFFPPELLTDEERDLRDRINCSGYYANDHS